MPPQKLVVVVVVVSWVGTKIQRRNENPYRGRLNQMQAFGLSPFNFCINWKVANIIRVNQVTRHPSSIGSDEPSKDPEIRQVRKLHSNAQKVEKELNKKAKSQGDRPKTHIEAKPTLP